MAANEHTLKQFDAELEAIRALVLQMGGLVEEQTVRAMEALTSGNIQLAARVVEDDHRVNALEVAIDEECSTIIARRQPAAGDLRMIMMVVKTITDLERIGDEAAKIGRMAQLIYESDRPYIPRTGEVRRVADIAVGMLRNALDAFARLDLAVAAKVVRQDEQVDDAFRGILRQLITFMMEDPQDHIALHRDPLRGEGDRADRRPCEEHVRVRRVHGEGQGRPPYRRRGLRARSADATLKRNSRGDSRANS
jgi:phosphate transport system protein